MGGSGGSGGGGQTSSSNSTLYNWQNILPPWVQSGQQSTLPWLMSRASEGMLPSEERTLKGGMREDIQLAGDKASQNLSRQVASSGMDPSSPMVAGGLTDLSVDKMNTTSKAALDFAKMKMGARDTAIGQLLTALYTPPPVAVGQSSTSTSQPSGGGGK